MDLAFQVEDRGEFPTLHEIHQNVANRSLDIFAGCAVIIMPNANSSCELGNLKDMGVRG